MRPALLCLTLVAALAGCQSRDRVTVETFSKAGDYIHGTVHNTSGEPVSEIEISFMCNGDPYRAAEAKMDYLGPQSDAEFSGFVVFQDCAPELASIRYVVSGVGPREQIYVDRLERAYGPEAR